MYEVRLDKFEGPLDLLLDLIQRHKMSINDVSLAHVANQYVAYLSSSPVFPLKEVSEFIVTAATLMLIKSRSLIPSLSLTEEEEESIHELETRLKLYAEFKRLSQDLRNIFGKGMMAGREPFAGYGIHFIAPRFKGEEVEKSVLREILRELIEKAPRKEEMEKAEVRKIISLEEKIQELAERIRDKIEFTFAEFTGHGSKTFDEEKKMDIIVSFLAILELAKQGIIMVRQETPFENISLRSV